MPTTRAARAAARAAARCLTEVLPADALGLVLYQLPLAHDIARTGLTCHAPCDAAKLARKARPFSPEVVTLTVNGPVHAVVTAPEGQVITGTFNQASMWMNGSKVLTFHSHLTALAMLPDGAHFMSGEGADNTVKLWTTDGSLKRTFETGDTPDRLAVCADGTLFVVGDWKGRLKLFRMEGTLVRTIQAHSRHVVSLAVTPDGQHFVSGSDDMRIKVWNFESEICDSSWHAGSQIYALAVTPDGTRVVSGSLSAHVKVWLLDGTLKNTFSLHTEGVYALVALPDNQHALSGSNDKTVKLFNVDDGAVLRTFNHPGIVLCLALLPDGLRFVSGSADNTARIAYHGLALQ